MNIEKHTSAGKARVEAAQSADLGGAHGKVRLPNGTILTHQILNKFKERGVVNNPINDLQVLSKDVKILLQQEIEQHINHRFRNLDDHPSMQKLKKIVLAHQKNGILS